ncbi:MAG: hypothetical protein D6773_00970 [Alphaproteobacteria bacterium]|nr:MAG: hypothetical protein D6773_00970 [Alphaproteobacteria bacterium]
MTVWRTSLKKKPKVVKTIHEAELEKVLKLLNQLEPMDTKFDKLKREAEQQAKISRQMYTISNKIMKDKTADKDTKDFAKYLRNVSYDFTMSLKDMFGIK